MTEKLDRSDIAKGRLDTHRAASRTKSRHHLRTECVINVTSLDEMRCELSGDN